MAFFGAAHGWGGGGGGVQKSPLPKICHIFPTMVKLSSYTLPKVKSKKYINHVTQPLSSADISIFSPEISEFCYVEI